MPKKTYPLGPKSVGLFVVLSLLSVTLLNSSLRAEGSEHPGETPAADVAAPLSDAAPASETKAVLIVRPAIPSSMTPAVKARKGTDLVFEIEGRLSELGYWTGPVTDFGSGVELGGHGISKGRGLRRTGKLSAGDLAVLRVAQSGPQPLEAGTAHVEVDLARQVLFLRGDDGTVSHVLPVSSGNGKPYTVEGCSGCGGHASGPLHQTYRKIAGERVAPLGLDLLPELSRRRHRHSMEARRFRRSPRATVVFEYRCGRARRERHDPGRHRRSRARRRLVLERSAVAESRSRRKRARELQRFDGVPVALVVWLSSCRPR